MCKKESIGTIFGSYSTRDIKIYIAKIRINKLAIKSKKGK